MIFENIFSESGRKKQIKIREKPKIIADHREKNSLVISELIEQGADVQIKYLRVADFIIKDTAVERKTVSDFINSMINKRLITQLQEIKQYPSYLLLIEGVNEQELYNDEPGEFGVHPNAIRGFLLSILLDFKVPIIFTKDYEDTARFLLVLAKRKEKEASIRALKRARDKKESLQFILEGFPGIGPKTAKKLLKKYKTIKSIINTDIEELKKDIGKKAGIFKLLEEKY